MRGRWSRSRPSFYGTWLREYSNQDHDLGYELMKRMTEVVIRRLQATRQQLLPDGSTIRS